MKSLELIGGVLLLLAATGKKKNIVLLLAATGGGKKKISKMEDFPLVLMSEGDIVFYYSLLHC